jgi:hypothetical protein
MHQRNISCESLYTVRAIKEVKVYLRRNSWSYLVSGHSSYNLTCWLTVFGVHSS